MGEPDIERVERRTCPNCEHFYREKTLADGRRDEVLRILVNREKLNPAPMVLDVSAADAALRARVAELEQRVADLADSLYCLHVQSCEAFTPYGRHAPECKLYDLTEDEIEAARLRAEGRKQG